MFDPSLKKKKKKKKTFDLDAEMGTPAETAEDKAEVGEDNKEAAEKEDDDLDLESFGKKKKKKKKVVDFDEEKGAEDAGEKEVAGDGKKCISIIGFNFSFSLIKRFDCLSRFQMFVMLNIFHFQMILILKALERKRKRRRIEMCWKWRT